MPTQHPRVSFTVEKSIAGFLINLAQHENISVSKLTKELVLEALERREDMALSSLAEARDIPKTKRIKHHDAWK